MSARFLMRHPQQLRKRLFTAFVPCALVAIGLACDGSGRSYRSPTAPPAPTVPSLARLWKGTTTIESIDELLAQCATPLVTPGVRESVAVYVTESQFGISFSMASEVRFSPELGLLAVVDGQTIRAESVPAVFYYEDAAYIECRNGHPVERVWVYGGSFSGVFTNDRITGTLQIFYRTGSVVLDPGTIVSSYERLELVRAEP